MKNAKGQAVRWVIPEDFFAHAKETMSPKEFAKLEEGYKHTLEQIREQTAAFCRLISDGNSAALGKRALQSVPRSVTTSVPAHRAGHNRNHYVSPQVPLWWRPVNE
jgi:hypothetical protein